MAELTFDIEKEYGDLQEENARGWKKELNLVSWNGRKAKYDLREWAPDHSRMGKGVTLTITEMCALRDLLNSMDELDDDEMEEA